MDLKKTRSAFRSGGDTPFVLITLFALGLMISAMPALADSLMGLLPGMDGSPYRQQIEMQSFEKPLSNQINVAELYLGEPVVGLLELDNESRVVNGFWHSSGSKAREQTIYDSLQAAVADSGNPIISVAHDTSCLPLDNPNGLSRVTSDLTTFRNGAHLVLWDTPKGSRLGYFVSLKPAGGFDGSENPLDPQAGIEQLTARYGEAANYSSKGEWWATWSQAAQRANAELNTLQNGHGLQAASCRLDMPKQHWPFFERASYEVGLLFPDGVVTLHTPSLLYGFAFPGVHIATANQSVVTVAYKRESVGVADYASLRARLREELGSPNFSVMHQFLYSARTESIDAWISRSQHIDLIFTSNEPGGLTGKVELTLGETKVPSLLAPPTSERQGPGPSSVPDAED